MECVAIAPQGGLQHNSPGERKKVQSDEGVKSTIKDEKPLRGFSPDVLVEALALLQGSTDPTRGSQLNAAPEGRPPEDHDLQPPLHPPSQRR